VQSRKELKRGITSNRQHSSGASEPFRRFNNVNCAPFALAVLSRIFLKHTIECSGSCREYRDLASSGLVVPCTTSRLPFSLPRLLRPSFTVPTLTSRYVCSFYFLAISASLSLSLPLSLSLSLSPAPLLISFYIFLFSTSPLPLRPCTYEVTGLRRRKLNDEFRSYSYVTRIPISTS